MIAVRQDQGAQGLRLAARLEKMGKVVLRLLGIAHILDGRGRAESAALVGLEPQSLARAVDRYNAEGIAGLKDRTIPGRPCKLSSEQSAELKRIVLAGPEDRENGHPEFKIRHIVDLIEKKMGHSHECRGHAHEASFAEVGETGVSTGAPQGGSGRPGRVQGDVP